MIEITCFRCEELISDYAEIDLVYLTDDRPVTMHVGCKNPEDVLLHILHLKDMSEEDMLRLVWNMLLWGEQRRSLQHDVLTAGARVQHVIKKHREAYNMLQTQRKEIALLRAQLGRE